MNTKWSSVGFVFVVVLALLAITGTASASSVSSATFTGGAGTATVGGTLYAKNGAALTLSVTTSADAQCVDVAGAFTGHQTSSSGKSSWTFNFTAGAGDGTQTVTVTAMPNVNAQGKCTGSAGSANASIVLDNTPPAVSSAVSPAPNAAGWNHGDVTIAWSAVDSGSGVASGPTPASDSQTTNTAGTTKTSTATDRVGNTGTGSVTVKLDTQAPTIGHTLVPAPNAFGWNNSNVTVSFNCSDALSGIKSCAGSGSATAEGSTSFGGAATDNADNTASDSVVVKIDKTKPVVTGAPTTSPNASGWYNGDVTVHWTANDNLGGSGLDPSTIPADTTVSGEGANQAAGPVTVADQAGNVSNPASVTGLKIDRTAPNTVATAPSTNWNNTAVTVSLSASDNLSGVASTHYQLDGGADTPYSAVAQIPISTDGQHTLAFWSVDNAGNVEAAKTIVVKIDQTPPTISHTQSPAANGNGWNRTDVTITYICADALSGIRSPDGCPAANTITAEGLAIPVAGAAFDIAGNSTNDLGTVSIDKTDPTVTTAVQGTPSAFGWFNAPVVVKFTCSDGLSGVAACAAAQTLGEGAGQSGSGSSSDNADNTGTATFSGINVDTTPPSLSGTPTTPANANGWYSGDVTVHWTASDALSGLDPATVPADSTVTGEGAALAAIASVSDKAGNTTAASVTGIKIDRTAPNTTATVRDPDFNGWYASPVEVTLTPFDGLSGVDGTLYNVDGGSAQSYSVPFTFIDGGVHTIRFWSVDKAGNVESHADDAHAITLKIDNIPPTITGSRAPAANAFGWNNEPVNVFFNCSDDETGVAPEDCSAPTLLNTEGAAQSVTGTAHDRAGNAAEATVSDVNIDLTPPTLTGAPTTAPNGNGWYNSDVTVHWTADDALSGVDPATVPADTVVTGEGEDLGTPVVHVSDKAGNPASASYAGIHIDRTAPQTTASVPTDPSLLRNGWYTGPVQVSLLGSDALSGVAATKYSIDGGPGQDYDGSFQFNLGGIHTITFWSVDNAGNVEDRTAPANTITLKIDNIDPTITGARQSGDGANAFGWNNAPVGVVFDCNDAETGIQSCDGAKTLTTEGQGQSVTGLATDYAGNKASATVDGINIDLTKPTLDGAPTTAPTAAGWYNGDVVVHWSPFDALSGIDSSTAPADTTITGEGADLSAGPVTVKDEAGNESDPASITGIKIDRTPPVITGGATTPPNANGWYNSSVTVDFSCSDALSGVATCPSSQLLSVDGADQGVTSDPAFDNAGNKADGLHIGGINIDGQVPTTHASLNCDLSNAFCRGASATVDLDATDQGGLSGVAEIHYSVDGGSEHVVAGDSTSVDVPLLGSGTAHVSFYAVDRAGNKEDVNSSTIQWDNIAPTVSHSISPAPNASGWDNSDTTVTFAATDDFSGVASISPPVLVTTDTPGLDVPGFAYDVAGNKGTDSAHVQLDKTPPTIDASRAPAANVFGWNNESVTVSFDCADPLSAVALCPDPVSVTEEGADQSITRSAKDNADNSASATIGDINVDLTQPDLSGAPTASPNANGWYNGDVTVHWTASDALSGIDPATTPADSVVTGEGMDLSASATVADKAGNSRTTTVDGIDIDRTDPSTLIAVPDPLPSGWYADKVPVTLNATDALSGVDSTYYSVDDGAPTPYAGVFDYAVRGIHTLRYWSVDRAGNVEAKNSKLLKIDDVPPTIDVATSPAPTKYGWNNTPVTAQFTCSDAESGVAACGPDTTFVNEGPNQSFTGTATDVAGNTSSKLVDGVDIDMTKPTLVGKPTTDPNAAGWYNGDVVVHWLATDGLSGIDPDTAPADTTVTGEGSNLTTGPVGVSDKAGNTQTASFDEIKIDRTAPSLAASVPAPNAFGWYNNAVTVSYNCSDALSGVATCPAPQQLDHDGAGQHVTSDTASDVAGNVAAGITTGGINIDGTAPQSTASASCGFGNDWCQSSVSITINATDQPGLSGVKSIVYSVNGGPSQTTYGSIANVTIALSSTGSAGVQFHAIDFAGNAEAPNGISIKYDNIAPTVTHTLDPAANGNGWDNMNTTVRFTATDDAGGSGVDPTTITPDTLVATETSGTTITGHASDYAGNVGSDPAKVKLDKTPPAISGAPTTSPNGKGWYAAPVTVHFTCSDALSGVATCPSDSVVSGNGANQSVNGVVMDAAGNQASTIVGPINIDAIAPTLAITNVADGGIYTLGTVPVAGCTASDGVSGLAAPCKVTVSGGTANGVGTYTVSATATDNAGNTATTSLTYRVIYRWDGFLQPVNDTAHQVGTSTSIFKGGSTVPMKFQLKTAGGAVVQANTVPIWLVPVKGSTVSAPVDETMYSDTATGGGTYVWDPTGPQYQYNWSTKNLASGFYYRVGVRLDDGQTYDVNVGLR